LPGTRRSVGEFSNIFYINKECEVLYKSWLRDGRPSDYAVPRARVENDLKQIAEARRRQRARLWAGKQLKKSLEKTPPADRVLGAMQRWQLGKLSQDETQWFPTQEGFRLGQIYIENHERGRLLLYDKIIKFEKDTPFSPSNFLLKLRDSSIDRIIPLLKKEISHKDLPVGISPARLVDIGLEKVADFDEFTIELSVKSDVPCKYNYDLAWSPSSTSDVLHSQQTFTNEKRAFKSRLGPVSNASGKLTFDVSANKSCKIQIRIERTFTPLVRLQEPLIGEVLDDKHFVSNVLRTNFYSFDIIRDWATYFDLANSRQLRPEEKEKICRVKCLAVDRPNYSVYLVMRISKVSESISVLQLVKQRRYTNIEEIAERLEYSKFTCECIVHNLVGCEILSTTDEIRISPRLVRTLPEKIEELGKFVVARSLIFPDNLTVFSDWPSQLGQITALEQVTGIPTTNIFLFGKPQVGEREFLSKLKDAHLKVTRNDPLSFGWIPIIRQYVCHSLRISNHQFDVLLHELFQKGLVDLGRGPGRFFAEQAIGKKRKGVREIEYAPFVYQGNPYTMVRPLE